MKATPRNTLVVHDTGLFPAPVEAGCDYAGGCGRWTVESVKVPLELRSWSGRPAVKRPCGPIHQPLPSRLFGGCRSGVCPKAWNAVVATGATRWAGGMTRLGEVVLPFWYTSNMILSTWCDTEVVFCNLWRLVGALHAGTAPRFRRGDRGDRGGNSLPHFCRLLH